MLNQHNVDFTYREYTKEPLTEAELRTLLDELGLTAHDVLRTRDATKHGFSKKDDADTLIAAMAQHPRMLQRPILRTAKGSAVGRPVDNLLTVI